MVRSDQTHSKAPLDFDQPALDALLNRFHVRKLVLFGSAARDELGPESDIDLMVEFEPNQTPSMGGFVDLQDALTEMFGGRKVDLTTTSILNNPYRKRSIEKDMKVLHAA